MRPGTEPVPDARQPPAWLCSLVARLTRWAYTPFPPAGAAGRDPFRFCVWCDADTHDEDCEHAKDCPTNTGLRPVRPRDLGMRGPNDPYAYGMMCMDCGEPFRIGDYSALRPTEQGDWFEVVCVGCRVLNPGPKEAT